VPVNAAPRLGFVGVGWIGRNRMEAIHAAGVAEIVAVADADASAAAEAAANTGASVAPVDDILNGALALDGVVIATPNALHGGQAIAALSAGQAVFCQKPLGRSAEECAAIVNAARCSDRLLGVDLSYRQLAATLRLEAELAAGAIGDVFAGDFVFHNAYGPDKAWFRDVSQSGGGCLLDLGTHLVDLALLLLAPAKVESVDAHLFAGGEVVSGDASRVEDYAVLTLGLSTGAVARIATSWFLHAGRDAVISATLQGTGGALALENVAGSFYDFRLLRHVGTSTEVLCEPPDAWGGRAAVAWAEQLASSPRFDPAIEDVVGVAGVIDEAYGR
jgi:predicted dehydrogenase